MSNKTYDTLKMIALLIMPAATFVMTLLMLFGVVDNVTGAAILAALDTFLGSVVAIANKTYNAQMSEETKG